MTKEELWRAVLAQIQLSISSANFATWFKNTEIVEVDDKRVIVSAPNNFSKEWLENKYHKLIFKILRNLNADVKEIQYQVLKSKMLTKSATSSHPLPLQETDQLEFQGLNIDRESSLNPRYLFENFVVGSFNELAHAAAQAVCKSPGLTYNPLFIYGGVGLGKTHLLQAIGNEVLKNFPQKKVKYLTTEKFASEVVSSIRNHNMENLKSVYRKIDVLIIDDVQFLAGKEKTQEEFFHTFNTLYEKNKQIVLSSDRPPNAIHALEERLCSRFEGGMIADIGLPDFETRMAILKIKTQEKKANLNPQVLEYIANNVKKNIRELEGALNQVIVYQKVNNTSPNLERVKTLLKNIVSGPTQKATPKKIIQKVAEFYDLKEAELANSSRKKEIVKPRQIAMYLLRTELSSSFPFIGRKFGGRDHTTAIYACEKIAEGIEKDDKLKEEVEVIKQIIYKS